MKKQTEAETTAKASQREPIDAADGLCDLSFVSRPFPDFLPGLNLSDEQESKIDKIDKKYAPKFQKLRNEMISF